MSEVSYISPFFRWFLWVMLFVNFAYYVIDKCFNMNKFKSRIIGLCIVSIFIVLFQVIKLKTWVSIEITPMALLFYLLGVYYNNKCTESTNGFFFKTIGWIFDKWVVLLPVSVIVSYWNKPFTMYSNEYGNFILFFIGAFCGIIMVIQLSKSLDNNKFLSWWGRNSIIVYVLHFNLIASLHGFGNILFKGKISNYDYPANWHYFLLCIIILAVLIPICNRWFAPLFGKKK